MSKEDITRVLGQWEGYRSGKVWRIEPATKEGQAIINIELLPEPRYPLICDGCAEPVAHVHDITKRQVRDLPILDASTLLIVHRQRVECPRCGPKLQRLPWLDRYQRVTKRLADSVARMCCVLPVKHVAEHFGLGWDTVKSIDKNALKDAFEAEEFSDIEAIVMDEFAIQKGHRYATVIARPDNRQVLWVGRGRSRLDVRPFFEALGKDGCARVEAVGMDMNGAYEKEVRLHCPNAHIVYDLFHVVAKYAREVIDRVRVDESNRLRADKYARKVIKGSRWLLLRNAGNIGRTEDRIRLSELLGANKALATVYVLKEDLKHLWDYKYTGAAMRFWKQWYRRAMYSRIEPLKKFAQRLKQYLPGILAHCRWPLHTSVLEGINNKIKVIKRMAYGFRDDEYFFLKIRAAFPGIPG